MPEQRIRRVLMTGDTVGGVWTFTLELAEALAANGIEVVLATLGGPPSAEQASEAARVPGLCFLASDFKLEWMDDPWRDVEESGRWLLELEREYNPDLVHLNSFGHGALQWSAPTVLTAHSCVLSWWKAVRNEDAPASWNRYREAVRSSLQSADSLTAPSAAMAATLKDNYGAGRFRCTVIPNGRTPSKFLPAVKDPFIFTAGRLWDEAKNAAAVARVAPALSWRVYVAGDARHPARHPDGSVTAFEGCHALGHLSQESIADWYGRAAIYALPARYEPFGLSALEAGLSGCALLLGDIPSLREIWDDAAMFVSPDDDGALRKGLEALIGDAALRQALAKRSYARALKFTAERMARQYIETYIHTCHVAGRDHQCVS